ncbi:unnamed protein product, partial [Ixodes hexagonus]
NAVLLNALYRTPETPETPKTPRPDTTSNRPSVKTGPPSGCSRKSNVVFVNTHECSNSTVATMFQRYGLTHSLNFVLPKEGPSLYIGHPKSFRWTMVQPLARPNLTYNLLVHHVVYDRPEIARGMPNDTVYVTILRRPETSFQTTYRRCQLQKVFKMSLEEFIRDNKLTSSLLSRRLLGGRVGFDQSSFNLGLYPGSSPKTPTSKDAIKTLETDFDIVMIGEKLDASLLLLKRLLCWDVADVATLSFREPTDLQTLPLPAEAVSTLASFNELDDSIYKHFSRVVNARVKKAKGPQMQRDWEQLLQARAVITEACSSNRVPKVQGQWMDANTCEYFRLSESEMTVLMHQHQEINMRRLQLS